MLDLSVIWELTEWWAASTAGIKLVVPGRVVDAWQPFETAYGTEGGDGAITSRGALDAMAKEQVASGTRRRRSLVRGERCRRRWQRRHGRVRERVSAIVGSR